MAIEIGRDERNITMLLPVLPDEQFDLVFTSPPFFDFEHFIFGCSLGAVGL